MNNIKKHFSALGYKISLNRCKTDPRRHFLQYKAGPSKDRLLNLVEYYFGDTLWPFDGACIVFLEHFKSEGHEVTGVCRKCGCTQNDACEDPDTGTCYWIEEDLCSACGSPEQRAAAMQEMSSYFDGEE